MSNKETLAVDPLLECLVLYTKLYHKPYTAESLVAGLPKQKGESTPELFSLTSSKSLFSRAAKRAGLVSRLVRKSIDDISPLVLPIIVVLKGHNACILESFNEDKTKAKIILPETGESENWVDIDDLKKEYLGYAFYLKKEYDYKGKRLNLIDNKQKHWFWGTLMLSKKIYRDVIIASFLINLALIATPLFTMNVYDRVVPNNATDTLWVLAIGIFAVYVLDLIIKLTRSYFLEIAAKKSDIIMSSILFEKVLDIKMEAKPKSVGSFASNLRDFDSIRSFLASSTLAVVVDIPFLFIFLGVVSILAGSMVFVPITVIIIVLIYTLAIRAPLQKSIEETHEAAANKNSVLIESLVNLETIKTMGAHGTAQWQWEEASGEIASKGLKSKILGTSIPAVTQFFVQLNTIALVAVGVYQIQDKNLTMGALIATVMLSSRAIAPVGQIASLITNYENTKTAYNGLDNIMQMPVERPEGKQFIQRAFLKGNIEFKNVTFRYPDEEKPALKNVSFKIKHGEKVGIIGKIGSGKSTIEKLILGLYEPQEGTILIDGIDIKQIDPADLRKNISYIPQDITLFKGTVKDNIVYKAPHSNDASIIRAAKISGVENFANRHPRGFDMSVGERGEGLSGGQRQSIAIARAFLVETPIVLMDEITNMMDSSSENEVIKNIKENIDDRTVILVSHKTSLLSLVDRLIVMDEGMVLLDDSKDSVIKKLKNKA